MSFHRRAAVRTLAALTLAAGASLLAAPAAAQIADGRPIKIIVPYLAGGVTDVMARQFAMVLSDKLKQQVLVENKPGGNTIIATQFVAAAPADGSTLFFTDLSLLSYTAHLYKQAPYDLARDFAPVSSVAEIPLALAVNGQVPPSTMKDFVAYAKANPGKLNYATTASGGLPHLGMENLKAVVGIDLTHVPYKGAADAIKDMVGNQVQVMFNDISTSAQFVATGKMKVLAMSGSRRAPKLPDVPTFNELGYPNLNVRALMGIVVPAKTPRPVVEKLTVAIREAAASQQISDYLQTNNIASNVTAGADLKTLMDSEERKWRDLVKKLNLSVD
jgi:tripartite-type tricarboxylate transporter receptor subunit TctC